MAGIFRGVLNFVENRNKPYFRDCYPNERAALHAHAHTVWE